MRFILCMVLLVGCNDGESAKTYRVTWDPCPECQTDPVRWFPDALVVENGEAFLYRCDGEGITFGGSFDALKSTETADGITWSWTDVANTTVTAHAVLVDEPCP